jgi:2-(1,2-epoxy-1,2-dihydrophenyl)acetyl-CoA isomerase
MGEDSPAGVLEVETIGRLRVLRLNRPERKNALNNALMRTLMDALRDAAHDDEVWALVITGNGDAFCSGLDLDQSDGDDAGDAPDGEPGERDEPRNHFSLLMRIECEKPIVAGVNGVAVGIGLSLAMNADIRIAAPSARFHPGYARVATSPDGGLSWTLTRAVGYERAMRFLLEQRMLSAPEALALGLVSEVTETDDAFEARLLDYGQLLASVAPIAARQTKRVLVRIDQPPDLPQHLDDEIELALHGLASEDSKEAIRAMMSRERPEFTGR